MSWRYQPVFIEQDGERFYSLCEVYFDDAEKFIGWTECEAIAAGGEDMERLTNDLARMMTDAFSWEPVRFTDLKLSIIFKRRISMEYRNRLADFVGHTADAFKRAQKPIIN